jgi:hypothetical protein
MDISELYAHIYESVGLKLASPKRAPRIRKIAVRGLRLKERTTLPPGVLPRQPDLHYFQIDKSAGADARDYWKECEVEQGIRMALAEELLEKMESFQPTLYVALKKRR